MAHRFRFVLGIAAGACVGVALMIAAVYFKAELTIFGVNTMILGLIGIIACWQIEDTRFKIGPAVVSGLAFIACVLYFVELAVFRPAVTYNDLHHFATLRFLITEVQYDRAAIVYIDEAFDAAWLPVLTLSIACFVAGFLSSKIRIAGKRSKTSRRGRISVAVVMTLFTAIAMVLNLSSFYQWELLPNASEYWIRYPIPFLMFLIDVYVQKFGLETTAKGTPIDMRWHSIGLIAVLACFYGIAAPRILTYVTWIPWLWLVAAIPLGLAFVARTAMESFAKQRRIGRLVAIEAVAAGLIVIETYLMMLMFSIGIQ